MSTKKIGLWLNFILSSRIVGSHENVPESLYRSRQLCPAQAACGTQSLSDGMDPGADIRHWPDQER